MQKQDMPFTLHVYNAQQTREHVYNLPPGALRTMLRGIRAVNKHRPASKLWRVVRNSGGRELSGLRDD